ncbi:unnamed protein product [Prorocentrum cordatum]|uniref:chorismate mutase n=1 Tax=Prorocentrum cordatum TaxID=2364126 RepID=A0ABN9V5S8_9DINO|nr:unnamed protein product [Polarella glacialis]
MSSHDSINGHWAQRPCDIPVYSHAQYRRDGKSCTLGDTEGNELRRQCIIELTWDKLPDDIDSDEICPKQPCYNKDGTEKYFKETFYRIYNQRHAQRTFPAASVNKGMACDLAAFLSGGWSISKCRFGVLPRCLVFVYGVESLDSARINRRLLDIYRRSIVPTLCEEGDDGNYGSTSVQDVHCVQTMATRIYFGLFVAESKFRSETEKATRLIKARDREGLMAFITKPEVEKRNVQRVVLKVPPRRPPRSVPPGPELLESVLESVLVVESVLESMCWSERESGAAWSRPPGGGVGELVDAGADVLGGAGVGSRLVQASWGRGR